MTYFGQDPQVFICDKCMRPGRQVVDPMWIFFQIRCKEHLIQ